MSMDRRQFLKIMGISSLFGLGASAASATYPVIAPGLRPDQARTKENALIAKRWAMVVDMSKFKNEEDIKKVIAVCHTAHNVPDFGNIKDEIKWIWKEPFKNAFPGQEHDRMSAEQKHLPFIVLCNHCDNPACVRVCPTQATFKRKDGIVMMDMHRCIGCRYCMAACPYGARSFNYRDPRGKDATGRPFIKEENKEHPTRTRGVVEKCTFCTERLAIGKMPYCVEAAPQGGLIFGDLDDQNSEVSKIVSSKYTIRRKPELGTRPSIFYVIGG